MSRWVDVRICAEDGMRALRLLLNGLNRGRGVTLSYDPEPPAAGPEHEVRIQDVNEADVSSVLRRGGISVLAIRTRLDSDAETIWGVRNRTAAETEACG